MTKTNTTTEPTAVDYEQFDVFAAARWLGELWNSSAAAIAVDQIEWQCTTWGSGRGCGDWVDTAIFCVVAEAFDLSTWRNHDGRDELVVAVPMGKFADIARLVARLDRYSPEGWPWLGEDVEDPAGVAAEFLGLPRAAVDEDVDLLDALRLE